MPTLDDLAVQTVGEQQWRILRLEEENRHLRATVRAQAVMLAREEVTKPADEPLPQDP